MTWVQVATIIAITLDINIGDDGYGAWTYAEMLINNLADGFEKEGPGECLYGHADCAMTCTARQFDREVFRKTATMTSLYNDGELHYIECPCIKYWNLSQCSTCLALDEHTPECIPCFDTLCEALYVPSQIEITFPEEEKK